MMAQVSLYTTRFCPFCIRAKMLLEAKNVTYTEVPVDADPAERRLMATRAGANTVPQIWIGEQHIGGCDELYQLEREGLLDGLLGEHYE